MARAHTLTVTVKMGAYAQQFKELMLMLNDLYDMVPDWRAAERDEAAERIGVLLTRMTNIDYTKDNDDG